MKNGFTIVELLVALVISMAVVGAVVSVFLVQSDHYERQDKVVEMHETVRGGLQVMVGDLMMAGYDPTGMSGLGIGPASSAAIQFTADLNGNGSLDAGETIDISSGPVNIYLAGGMEAKNGSNINISGATTEFSIFSNSTDAIVFKHGSAFKGVVYAPYADIEMKNSADVYGQLWGSTVDIKNSGQFFFDTALKDKYKANTVSLHSWRDTRY